MEKYESKQQQIRRPASQIYTLLSDFSNFTPIVGDKVDGWKATENSCSFSVKGLPLTLNIEEKVPCEYIKIGGGKTSPVEFNLWVQMKEVEPNDTRIRLVLHAKLNMVMRMMVGSKIQSGLDQMAEQIAESFNGRI